MQIRFKRTEVRLDFSFILVLSLMLLLCKEKTILICLLSSSLHEAGHLFMMKLCGVEVKSVNFGAFGVRIERVYSSASYKSEILIALGGIFVNLLIMLIGSIFWLLTKRKDALVISVINGFIALFNMIPIETLDFGKALSFALLMKKDEETAARLTEKISLVFTVIFLISTILYTAFVGFNVSLIAVSVYLMLAPSV